MTTHLGPPVPRLTPAELQRLADRSRCAARMFLALGDTISAMRALRASAHYRSRLGPGAARAVASRAPARSRLARAR